MTTSQSSEVIVWDDRLMALLSSLVPVLGTHGCLKLARNVTLEVTSSVLEFRDAGGRVLAAHPSAFGLVPGTRLSGPLSQRCSDERRWPEQAQTQRWILNDREITSPMRAGTDPLRVVYLPLQVPTRTDEHIVFTLRNTTDTPIDLMKGIQQAICWVDGAPFEVTRQPVWNGTYHIAPGRAKSRRFSLAEFPGAPRSGSHTMSLEICGLRSPPETVFWRGDIQ
ncbi:MAG TPA: hypothetical protein VIV60_09960 [Polyangiaceae bacterium]